MWKRSWHLFRSLKQIRGGRGWPHFLLNQIGKGLVAFLEATAN